MKKTTLFCAILCTVLGIQSPLAYGANEISIIPKPISIEQNSGSYLLTDKTVIYYDSSLEKYAEYLADALSKPTGWDFKLKEGKGKKGIQLTLSSEINKAEGYKLIVTSQNVSLSGADPAGVFYAIQSLLQLFPAEIYSSERQKGVVWEVPAISIFDAPERPWRGMMLDVARYFYDKEFVKKYIDRMAMYKLNKLQFHLIDDSGWRLEIKKYPRLTEVGAWAGNNTHRLGGYYTQEDIKEIIEYAQFRNVEIIPEIEFPAHMLSAVVAYPWLSCTEIQHEVPVQHFISRDLLCVGKESSYQFLEDVLKETVELFPSPYINIGGDEAVYTRWEECPKCQAVMNREGLKKASELQGYLTNVVSDMMKKYNRTVIGWEEIIQRGEIKNPVVSVYWHNVSDTLQATQTGHKAVLTPATHMYFDFPESATPGEVKAAGWMPPISLEKCYSMPINDYSSSSTVLGVQGCFWSDQFIHGTVLQEIPLLDENRSENYAEYLTFPRLLALSEVAWGKMKDRDYADFSDRVSRHYKRLDYCGCNYRVPEPIITSEKKLPDGKTEFVLSPSVEGAEIVYTTNGVYPTVHSPRYDGPVTVDQKSDFHAMTVVSPRKYSLPIYFAPDYSAYAKYGTYVSEWKPLQVQSVLSAWKFECTGKIAGNGEYEVTFVRTKGSNDFHLGNLKLLKRDEQLAEVKHDILLTEDCETVSYRFKVDEFEAGTPFFIEVMAAGRGGNDTYGLVFIKKVQ